jgi:crossover junction endodeoxyribonuclease RuvC
MSCYDRYKGWAIIDKVLSRIQLVSCGAITTEKSLPIHKRLLIIYNEMKQILTTYCPASLAIEQVYFAANAKTAIDVAQARGVILLTGAQLGIPVQSYSPLQVKQTLTGDGRADKRQVQFMLTKTLKIHKAPEPDDVADAVAIALTHAYTQQFT